MPTTNWTVERALEVCQRGKETALYLGGGVAGLAIVGSGDFASVFFSKSPGFIMATFITFVIVTAALFARSYRAYARQEMDLRRDIADETCTESDTSPDLPNQRRGEKFRQSALVMLLLS